MRRRVGIFLLIGCLVGMIVGCSSTEGYDFDVSYDVNEYVTLGEYKGVAVEKIKAAKVTQEEIDASVQETLDSYAENVEVTDRSAQFGDFVNIDYVGTIDGQEFDGGTATDSELELGSDSFIEGFEEGLVGSLPGDTLNLNLTFPDDYQQEDLAGKAVTFAVTVNSVYTKTIPEYTDAFVQEISDYETIADYEKSIKESLQADNESISEDSLRTDVWAKVVENAKVDGYPEELYDTYYDQVISDYTESAEMFGYDSYEEFVFDYLEMTEDDLKEEAISAIQEDLIFEAIVEKEGINLTEQEYKEGAKTYLEEYGVDSVDALEETYGKESIEMGIVWEKMLDLLVKKAVVNEVSESDYYGSSSSTEMETE